MTPYTFRLAGVDDLPLLEKWLRSPEVVQWWGDPHEQLALLQEDLSNPLMTMRIVFFEGHPFAYAQDYAVHTWPQPHFFQLPEKSRAIDSFIGEPDMIDKGHGSKYLRLLAEHLINSGAPIVAVDPDPNNYRARRAYRKAGFLGDEVAESGDGAVVVMLFE